MQEKLEKKHCQWEFKWQKLFAISSFAIIYEITSCLLCMYVTYAHQPEMKNLEIGRGKKKQEIKKFVCKHVFIFTYFLFHLSLPTKSSTYIQGIS